ncbi:MAG: hypothetical protein ACO1N0_20915 [Fluviicola sp.]
MKEQITLLLCLFSFLGHAQDLKERSDNEFIYTTNQQEIIGSIPKDKENMNSQKQLKYGFAINQSLTRYGIPTAVLFTLHYERHQFDLGPQFRLGEAFNKNQKYLGAEFNYRFYPHADTTWFNPYLIFNASYFNEFTERPGTYTSDDPALNAQPTSYTRRDHNLVLNIGYGVKFRLLGGFHIGSHVGIGIYKYSNISERTMTQIDWSSSSKTSNLDAGFLVSVFIGYKF